ncbi:phosphodiester glycosidase family protein [Paenibacillus assamensis]|uniref:phosphodiester glycosidase family protein n=1 Tax=Paenibacillus assamensis TaxID=311244 RepID=UPI001FDF999F|nr:phosphodiester glycosidase family protein [Paenibacillus assamensis]
MEGRDEMYKETSDRRNRVNRVFKSLTMVAALSMLLVPTNAYAVPTASSNVGGKFEVPTALASKPKLAAPRVSSKSIKVGSRSIAVQTVHVPKGYVPAAAFGKGKYGAAASLNEMMRNHRATAGINATFFEAYNGAPEPWGTVIINGRIEHVGNHGTTIGFRQDGSALMDTLRVKLRGTVTNEKTAREQGWYAYFVNRTPAKNSSSAIMFTPMRGSHLGFAYGNAVTVRNGQVTSVTSGQNVPIPKDGYVLVYTGKEKKMAERFKKGDKVTQVFEYTNKDGQAIDWQDVQTAVGAGPRLVKDGRVALQPKAEGFQQDKILTLSATRSGIGIMPDGSIMLATTGSATMKQWAEVWKQLGAKQAMNLDGGASTGLYANNKVITSPGRLLSNVLMFKQPKS